MNNHSHLILENEHVRLEPLQLYHLTDLLPIAKKHPNLLQYSPSPFGDKDTLEAYISVALQQRQKGNRYPFIIWSKVLQRFVGSTSYGNITMAHQRLEIGWTWLEKAVQGTGLNYHCKFLLLTYGFEELGLKRIELKTDDRNLASKKAIQKIGGQQEGTLRSHTLMQDGFRRDTTYFGILQEAWPKLKDEIYKGFPPLSFQQQPFQATLRLTTLKATEKLPMDLLRLADPNEDRIKSYFPASEAWQVYQGDHLLGCCVVLKQYPNVIIKNLAVYPAYQNLGIGQFLLSHLIQISKAKGFSRLEIATASTSIGPLYLYQKMGFRIQMVNRDFFTKNYKAPIVENGLTIKDQIVLEMKF